MFIDYQFSWEYHINHFVKQISVAKRILSIFRYYATLSVLTKVYFSIVYSHLNYGITARGGAAAKYLNKIEVQQILIVKVMTKVSLYKTKVLPIYNELIFFNLSNIYRLRFVYKFERVCYLIVSLITVSMSLKRL